MFNTNLSKIISLIKVFLIALTDAISVLLLDEKNNIYWMFLVFSNVFFLVSFSDLIHVRKSMKMEYTIKMPLIFVLLLINVMYSIVIILLSMSNGDFFKEYLNVIIVLFIFALAYTLTIGMLLVGTKSVAKKEEKAKKERLFYNLLIDELTRIKENYDLHIYNALIDELLEYIKYSMTVDSSDVCKECELVIANSLIVLEEEISENKMESVEFILKEMKKNLIKRENIMKYEKAI